MTPCQHGLDLYGREPLPPRVLILRQRPGRVMHFQPILRIEQFGIDDEVEPTRCHRGPEQDSLRARSKCLVGKNPSGWLGGSMLRPNQSSRQSHVNSSHSSGHSPAR